MELAPSLAADPEQSTGVRWRTELKGHAAARGLSTLIKRTCEGPALSGLLALGSQGLQIKPQRECLAQSSKVQAASEWVSRGGRAQV